MAHAEQTEPLTDDIPPDTWWSRYSPHGELPLSSIASISLHLFVILFLAVGIGWLLPKPGKPVALNPQGYAFTEGEGGSSGDGTSQAAGGGGPSDASNAEPADPADAEMAEATGADKSATPETPVSNTPATEVANAAPVEETPINSNVQEEIRQRTQSDISKAKSAADAMRRKLKDRFKGAGGGSGGGSGSGKGDSSGSGQGGGGGGDGDGSGRGGRQARWVLNFSFGGPKQYLDQIHGLGAAFALPASGGSLNYYDLSSSPPKPIRGSVDNESRITWIDENHNNLDSLCRYLRCPAAEYSLIFLPVELERRMSEMELSFNNLREDEIASTLFVVVPKGSGYDVKVQAQERRR